MSGTDALVIRDELREMLRSIVDQGSPMDSGGGYGVAHIWFQIGGKEFSIEIKDLGPVPQKIEKSN